MPAFDKSKTDYSVYLVTNSELVPVGLDFFEQVEKAIQSGVTIVQLREKDLDTGDFIRKARKLHEITQKYSVPLIINDRIDVALAVDAEGVHVGQDDMDPALVRQLLGKDKILGVSTRNEKELMCVINSEVAVDYVGMGTVYSTSTKNVKAPPLGISGAQALLKLIYDHKPSLRSVLIGGLNKYNIAWTLSHCAYKDHQTDGVAIVSCIMGQQNAALETAETRKSIELGFSSNKLVSYKAPSLTNSKPLIHFITNAVVKQFSANVCLSTNGSPIMSECIEEFENFAKLDNSCLVLNTGTMDASSVEKYQKAVAAYNSHMTPIVYDPVGCGASKIRSDNMRDLIQKAHFTVIKGNLAEIFKVAGVESNDMRGVDSDVQAEENEIIKVLSNLATRTKSVIVMTGKVDYIVDGIIPTATPRYTKIEGGHELMGKITGSGCALGGVIATYIAASSYLTSYEAAVQAVQLYKRAGQLAGEKSKGPGSFLNHFLDELYALANEPEAK